MAAPAAFSQKATRLSICSSCYNPYSFRRQSGKDFTLEFSVQEDFQIQLSAACFHCPSETGKTMQHGFFVRVKLVYFLQEAMASIQQSMLQQFVLHASNFFREFFSWIMEKKNGGGIASTPWKFQKCRYRSNRPQRA